MTSIENLHAIARLLGSKAVVELRDVDGDPVHSPVLEGTACVLLDNDQLLVADTSTQGLKTARLLVDRLQQPGAQRPIQIRPAADGIIKVLRNNSIQQNIEKNATAKDIAESDRSREQVLLDTLISTALNAGASDVHIETDKTKNSAIVRLRIDGVLIQQPGSSFALSETQARSLGSLIVNHESHRTGGTASGPFDELIPNDASFFSGHGGRSVKCRYAHQPVSSPRGLSIVIRLLPADEEGNTPNFTELGYSQVERALLERAFRFPHGIVLFTGPTGSGKSTAMAAGVSTLPDNIKVISYEDPVENRMPGVCQTQVNDRNPNTTYASYARAAMRQDPDVIIYGEIRDADVLRHSIHQANTGHLVLSTLHTNGAAEALQRMADLGVDFKRLSSPSLIRAIVAQRLVKKVCQACCMPLVDAIDQPWATDDHLRVHHFFADSAPDRLHSIVTSDVGRRDCVYCEGRGEVGRTPIVEIIMLDQSGRDLIRSGDLGGWLAYLKERGWQSMRDSAMAKVLRGTVCPLSVERALETPWGISADTFDYVKFAQQLQLREQEKLQKLTARLASV